MHPCKVSSNFIALQLPRFRQLSKLVASGTVSWQQSRSPQCWAAVKINGALGIPPVTVLPAVAFSNVLVKFEFVLGPPQFKAQNVELFKNGTNVGDLYRNQE